jgi:hypothetical protein
MTDQEFAKKHIEAMLKDSLAMFTNHPTKKNLTEKYNSDKSLAESYHGRELLELVQNADDAYVGVETAQQLQNDVLIEYRGNILRISNKGAAFDKDSVERLSQGNVSGKGLQYIGNKGIGFRSILNWAQEVKIFSGDYSFGFSKDFAAEQLEYLKNNFQNIRDEINAKPQITFPILWAPYWVENKLEPHYDTTIEIVIDPATQNDDWNVQKQIEEFDFNVLLFLQNITKISIKTDSDFYGLKREITKESGFNKVRLKKVNYKNDGAVVEERSFYNFKRDDEKIAHKGDDSLLKISVAIPCDFSSFESFLYTFFPIKNEKCPVPALLHATFLLEQNRSTIQNDQLNTLIFEKLMDFYVQVVTENFTKKEYGNTVAKLLTPSGAAWKIWSVQQQYKTLCSQKLSLLNVNGDFITLDRHPRIYNSFPSFFEGAQFELLCKAINDTRVSNFLEELIGKDNKFSSTDIKDIIDSSSEQWNSLQRIECFRWWLNSFKTTYYIPKIIKDQDGNWITSTDKQIFFPPSEDLTSIPKWHNVLILNRDDSTELEKLYRETEGKEDKRDVINYLNSLKIFTFREYSSDSLIIPLKTAIGNNYERAVEFIRWIRQNDKIESLTNSDEIFPCADNTVHSAKDIYLGNAYEDNSFIPFLKAAGKSELCEPSILFFEGENKELNNLKSFLKRFKFAEEPEIIEGKLNRHSISRECEEKYFENQKIQLSKSIDAEGNAEDRILNEASFITVAKIYDILEKIPTNEILKWIWGTKDNSGKIIQHLLTPETAKIFYKPTSKKLNDRRLNITTKSFLWYVFSFTPWISLGQSKKKYAPSECKFASRNALETVCLSEIITDEYLKGTSKEIGIEENALKYLFTNLGCNSNYLNLSPKSFYNLLLKLPTLENISESIKLSHSIYNNCIQALSKDKSYIDKYRNSQEGENFKQTGMLLCKNDSSYKPVKDIFFSSSSVLNPLRKLLFDVPLKNGETSSITQIFKILPYNLDWEKNIKASDEDISDLDPDFQLEWQKYIPFVLCLLVDSLQNIMIPKFRNLQLNLVSKLRDEQGTPIELEDGEYHLLEGENKRYFIYVGNGKLSKYSLSVAIGDLLRKILNTENNERISLYSELFRSDDDSRIGLIQQYGYVDALEDCRLKFSISNSEGNVILKYLQEKNCNITNMGKILDRLFAGVKLSIYEQDKLFHFLKENNLDVSDLKSVLDQQNITVIDYNKKQLKQKFEESEVRNIFEWALWIICESADEDVKFLFRSNKETLVDFVSEANIENTVSFDAESAIKSIFKEKFGCSIDEFDFSKKESTNCECVDDIYQSNRKKISISGNTNAEAFFDNPKIKSLLYFEVDSVQKKLNKWIEEESQKKQNAPTYISIPMNISINYGNTLEGSNPHFPSSGSKPSNKNSRKPSTPNNSNLQNQGDEAEKLVVAELRKNNIPDIRKLFNNQEFKVEWKSKAAERIEGTDGDDKLGYDILLRGKDGKLLYIDVKSHEENDCSFMMSSNEINFAKEHLTTDRDEYRIIYVSNFKLDSQEINPSINVLPKNFLDGSDFAMEYQNVRIYLKK